ncbi:fungal-specific transcription factor domain-containing protein [Biscogniauxia mediterranea]|nr:fungal-specific transcription factor domain-containing protein [Biscogniauxia mediterranea]
MFINIACGDYSEIQHMKHKASLQSSTTRHEPRNLPLSSPSSWNSPTDSTYNNTAISHDGESWDLNPPSWCRILPSYLSQGDAYLWDYFDKSMAPQCVLDQSSNPYRNVILRLATAFPEGPLFHCVLAVAANQLNSLGRTEYLPAMWSHRAHALRHLRGTIEQLCTMKGSIDESYIDLRSDQTVACALMLCFYDISQDCSESWTVHSRFVGSFLSSQSQSQKSLNVEEQALQDFALTYFVSHDILASTVSTTAASACATTNALCEFAEPESLQALTGFSKELLILISEINSLGSIRDNVNVSENQPLGRDQKQCRDEIERRLHHLNQRDRTNPNIPKEETHYISEAKRLAALMYLYARLDHASPHEPCMVRLTSQILSIIPNISLRTNTVLWPLFIAATLGIRPESDEDRRMVLNRLAALQDTRQLGNVKKARQVIESVWKARDINISDHKLSWDVLQGRHGTISLA